MNGYQYGDAMPIREYRSPEAFRTALEQRIRATVSGAKMNRFRQLLVFDRFLARVFAHFGSNATLKGGLVLELRLQRARTTKDVDLRLTGDSDDVLGAVRAAGLLALGDWLSFSIQPDTDMPRIKGEGMVYDGYRFRVQAKLGGKPYGGSFGVDVGFADVITVEPDVAQGSRFLEFAGVQPSSLRLYPRAAHIAEKLHAYTLPRDRPNTRVKDLPDLALLASTGSLDAAELRGAIEATFTFRNTHAVPTVIPAPPPAWAPAYERMAGEDDLAWRTLPAVYEAAQLFLDPLLRGSSGSWDHQAWHWI
jgi:hypothetical protein